VSDTLSKVNPPSPRVSVNNTYEKLPSVEAPFVTAISVCCGV
jgi:hypothetical protein